MTLDSVAAIVTIVSGPLAVIAIALVCGQLFLMRRDSAREGLSAEADLQRRVIPAIVIKESMMDHLESLWGCDIADHQQCPDEEAFQSIVDGVESDLAVAGQLRQRCYDIGVKQAITADRIETELKIIRYYLRRRQSEDRREYWSHRYPELMKSTFRLRFLLQELERSVPDESVEVDGQYYRGYRQQLSTRADVKTKPLVDAFLEKNIMWPPPPDDTA